MRDRLFHDRTSVLAMGSAARLLFACIPVALVWLSVMWALWQR
jgi:hypothetical protein